MKTKILLFSALIAFISCSKENNDLNDETLDLEKDIVSIENIDKATMEEKLKYKKLHLLKLGKWFIDNQLEIKEKIIALNGENQKEITLALEDIYRELNNSYASSSEKNEIEKSLNAFKNLNGDDWYPTIRLLDATRYSQRNPYDDQKVLIAIEEIIDSTQVFKGYQEDINGELNEIDEELTETLLGENDIILFDLGPCGVLIDPIHQRNSNPCGTTGTGNGNDLYKLKIDKMTVKHHKEGWPGRSEINFKGYKLSSLPQTSGDCGEVMHASVNCYNYDGRMIEQYHRSWINNQEERNLNWTLKTQQNFGSNDYIFYVIFEQDSWPANERTQTFTFPNGQIRNLKYRSWQTKYHSVLLSQDPNNNNNIPFANNYSYEDNAIKYNLKFGIN